MSAPTAREGERSGNGVYHSSSVDGDFNNLKETELTLALSLPAGAKTGGTKRAFPVAVDLHLRPSTTAISPDDHYSNTKSAPTPKAQVVGWPPVRANRKINNAMLMKSCKYVKVAVDGAPYLRKVDLQMYDSYEQLLSALHTMFSSLITIRNHLMNERKLMDPVNGTEYMPTYEDKDGDWMLLGDVPWKMFVESCKRIRIMIKSEAVGLGPGGTASRCTGSS